jgi:hypothetical protein
MQDEPIHHGPFRDTGKFCKTVLQRTVRRADRDAARSYALETRRNA